MTIFSPRPFIAVALLAFASATSFPAAAQEAEVPQKVAAIEGITEYKLKNGARLLLFPDPSASTVTVNLTVFVGSRHEGYGETGMAHLLEHMLFKGSKNFPNCDKTLQALGADYNGTTWTDRTNYFETMPATDANLELAVKFEADRLVNCFVKREDLVTEMTVVRNEFEMGENNPENILSQRMYALAFEWHNYGKSTIGNRSDIERVPIERLQAFYKKFYQPDNVMVIIAGKFDEAKALKYVAQSFGTLKAPNRTLELTYTEEPAQDGERSVTLRRVGKVAVVASLYHIPAAAHEDHPAIGILGSVLGDTPSGRLYKSLVETKKATKVGDDTTSWHDPGVLEFTAVVADKVKPEDVRDALVDVVEGTAKNPITKEEVDRQVKKYLSYREQAMTKSQRIAIELSEWAGAGDWRLLFLHRDRTAKVTADDVNRVAAKYLRSTNRTVGVFIPTKDADRTTIPETPNIANLVKDYKGGKALAAGEVFDPTPANIDARVKRIELSNGLKVALFPKKTRGEAVVGRFNLNFGTEKSLKDYTSSAGFLGSLMLRGTEKKSRQEIQDSLDKLSSSLSVSSGLGSLSISLQTKQQQLPALLALTREVLREPTFPEKEFDILKRVARQAYEKGLTDEKALASNALRRKLSPYAPDDIRYVPTIQESIDRLDKVGVADVVRLYKEQVGTASGELVLIGDFDPVAVVPLLEKIFSGWSTKTPYERIARVAQTKVPGSKETIQVPDKENAVYLGGLQFAMRDDDPDYAAAEMGNYILGGSGFTSRLMDRLRQKEGWCYGAGSQLSVGSQDKVGAYMVFAICNPANVDKVDAGTFEEIGSLLKNGISLDELDAAKKGYLEEMKVDRGKDAALAEMIRANLHLGRTFKYYADLEKKIADLKPDDVNQTMTRTLDPSRLVIIRAGDFTKKAAPAKKAPEKK
jgi:zinc protease